MRYRFLVETYRTEVEKVLSAWAMFDDQDMPRRPNTEDSRGRSLHEHLVHQSLSENLWFAKMLGIRVTEQPLPSNESRLEFIRTYAANATKRLAALEQQDDSWFEEEVDFFEVRRSRAWVLTRRIAHTAHHRGQQLALLRVLGRDLHSTYGPTADTGGLMQDQAPVIYAYPDVDTLLEQEAGPRAKSPLPPRPDRSLTERPD